MFKKLANNRRVCLAVLVGVLGVAAIASAETAEPSEPALMFVQLADPQLGMGGYEHDVETLKLAVEALNALEPDFVVVCGDLVHETASAEAFKDFKDIMSGLAVPHYCAAGNHDIGSPPTEETLARYREMIGEDYFAVDREGLRLVIVNTQFWKTPVENETAKHDAWLRETLADARGKDLPVIVAGHHPLFLRDAGEDEQYYNIPPGTRSEFLNLFKESGVLAILTGHAHREIIHEYEGMLFVTSQTTSRNFDGAPMGYRVWEMDEDGSLRHEYVAIEGAEPPQQN